jgi:alkaline phosphatase D
MFDANKTILGEEQWNWLSYQFTQPADVRIICTSTQFGTEYNGMESWANFPLEQEKMIATIVNQQANGVIFISGDVHYAECSKRIYPSCYPIYDITSSALNQANSGIANNTLEPLMHTTTPILAN